MIAQIDAGKGVKGGDLLTKNILKLIAALKRIPFSTSKKDRSSRPSSKDSANSNSTSTTNQAPSARLFIEMKKHAYRTSSFNQTQSAPGRNSHPRSVEGYFNSECGIWSRAGMPT
jgi:hypothetical protein